MAEQGANSRARVTVFVAEDHPLYRNALEAVIDADPGLALVGSAENGRAVFERIAHLQPDVVLLDVRMPSWGAGGRAAVVA